MMSHPAMSLGDRLCVSRKGGTRGGGWVHPKGANSMAVSGLRAAVQRSWSALGRPFPPILAQMDLESSCLAL